MAGSACSTTTSAGTRPTSTRPGWRTTSSSSDGALWLPPPRFGEGEQVRASRWPLAKVLTEPALSSSHPRPARLGGGKTPQPLSPRCPMSRSRKPARLGIEALEAREVPSTTLTGGVLTVRGTPGHDTIVLQSPTPNQTLVRVNGLLEFNQSAAINRIEIDGQGDEDWVVIRGVPAGVTDGVRVVNGELVDLG